MPLSLDPSCPVEWSHPLNRGLVGCWMDPGGALPGWRGGVTCRDLVRGGRKPNDGTRTTGVTWQGSQGRPGGYGALYSPATHSVSAVGNELTRVSYALWARWQLSGASDYPYVLGTYENGSPGTTDRRIKFNATTIVFSIFDGSTKSVTYTSGANNDIWWHLAATVDGSNIRLYVNGKLEGTTAAGDPYTGYSSPYIWFGSVGTSTTAAVFTDDVRIYSRVLSDSDAFALYRQSRRGHPDTLRWLSSKAWFFPDQGGGGTTHTQSLTGSLSLSAAIAKADHKPLAASLSLTPALAKRDQKALSGSLSLSAALAKKAKKALTGALSLSATLTRRARKALSASLSLAGGLTTRSFVLHVLSLSATLSLSAALARRANKGLSASLSLSGSLTRRVRKGLSAALSLVGAMAKRASKALTAALSLAGLLSSEVSEAVDSIPPILDMSKDFTRTVSMSKDFTRTIDQAFDWVEE